MLQDKQSGKIRDPAIDVDANHAERDWYFDNSKRHLKTTELVKNRRKNNQQAEDASRIASRMTRLLEVLPAGVIVLDGNGLIQECNTVAISLLGQPLEGEFWSDVIKRAFGTNTTGGHDISLIDGRLVHLSTSPLEVESGQIILIQDVTETRQLQKKISHLQRLSSMGEMAARLAHQIRTPLAAALLYLAPLLKPETDAKLQLRFAKRLHASITHMEQLIKDMLAYSRGDMAATTPVYVKKLLETVKQQFLSQPDAQNYHLEVQNSAKDGYVYGSQTGLVSALINLLNNARLACGQEGEITIYAEYVEDEQGVDCIEISVEDNGEGIAEQDKDKILTPFYTTSSSGTGLGLAVVQSIIKAHKGSLWFESDEGKGSTFSLRLPMYQPSHQFALKAQKIQE